MRQRKPEVSEKKGKGEEREREKVRKTRKKGKDGKRSCSGTFNPADSRDATLEAALHSLARRLAFRRQAYARVALYERPGARENASGCATLRSLGREESRDIRARLWRRMKREGERERERPWISPNNIASTRTRCARRWRRWQMCALTCAFLICAPQISRLGRNKHLVKTNGGSLSLSLYLSIHLSLSPVVREGDIRIYVALTDRLYTRRVTYVSARFFLTIDVARENDRARGYIARLDTFLRDRRSNRPPPGNQYRNS